MSTRINHNILSMTAQRNLNTTQRDLATTVSRLSSGLRINSAWDDPAGLAISERFRAQIASMEEAERNANYNINLITTAEGALSIIDEMLVRMRALSIQASNGALQDTDREALDLEFQLLRSEINRVAKTVNYNGRALLDGSLSGGLKFHVGTTNEEGQDYYFVNFSEMSTSALGLEQASLSQMTDAQSAIAMIDNAIQVKDTERTTLGAYVARLQHTINSLQISRENAVKSESQIRDADIAHEMSNFVRAQILVQSGVSMLSQANMVPRLVAQLLGG